MTHKEMVEIGYRWMLKNARCGIGFKELTCAYNGETPDVIGFSSWGHSVIVECKISRSDFLKDKKKPFRINPEIGMGKYRFYCCPTGLIKQEELPERWGLIYVNDKGRATLVYNPYGGVYKTKGCFSPERGFKSNILSEHQLLYSALRRLFIQGYAPKIYNKCYERITTKELIERNSKV